MSNQGTGLIQKQAKISAQSATQNDRNFSRKRTLVNPLGIRVDTDVGKRDQTPPQQVFPRKTDQANTKCISTHDSPIILKQRRQERPRPLKLEVKASDFSSRHAIRSSPNEALTPIIIITPTQDDTPKIQTQPRVGGLRRPRIASSIYTVASSWQSAVSPLRRSRTFSNVTAALDDSTPPLGVDQSFRNRDARRRSSIAGTVLATPYRSSGWWNVITSPFATRSSIMASSKSSNDSDPTEETPLCENVSPNAYGCSRAVGEEEENNTFAQQDLESGPFRHYSIPLTGEASKYYDQSYDYTTPALLPANIPTPDIPQSADTARGDLAPFSPEDGEAPILLAGEAPQLQESSRKVPTPQLPSQTPPQSSRAAVVETFPAMQSPIMDSRPAGLTKSLAPEELLSPTLPSPVVETASIGIVQTARTVESDSTRTPKPPFRQVTIDGTVNTDAERMGIDTPKSELIPTNQKGLASAFMTPVTCWTATSSTATPVSKASPVTKASSRGPTEKTRSFPFRSLHSASPNSNRPLVSSQGQRKVPFDVEKQLVQKGPKRNKRFNWTKENIFLVGISAILSITLLLAIVLCMTVVQDQSSVPVESHWLNLTGYPPLPIGISTVSEPRMLKEVSGCVAPNEMWSCTVPKGQQGPVQSSQPSFRLLVLFDNQSISNPALTQPVTARRALGNVSPSAYARHFVGRSLLYARNAVSAIMFSPLPSPPSSQDEVFLGRTTEGATYPFAGADTPFFISLLPTTVSESSESLQRSVRRGVTVSGPLSAIPQPSLSPGGKAEAPELHPFPEAQPLKLFNRGLPTEHYGFYSYFDKSIFLSSPPANSSSNAAAKSADMNKDGGAPAREANARCTWSQTRFLFQIWTNTNAALLSGSAQATHTHNIGSPKGMASAFDFSQPGSFPWPVTVTVDRHGGNAAEKGIYCYGVDEDGMIVTEQRAMHPEDRGFGGQLVNPAPHAFTAVDLSGNGGRYGGIDGGTGGCLCQWANWQ